MSPSLPSVDHNKFLLEITTQNYYPFIELNLKIDFLFLEIKRISTDKQVLKPQTLNLTQIMTG